MKQYQVVTLTAGLLAKLRKLFEPNKVETFLLNGTSDDNIIILDKVTDKTISINGYIPIASRQIVPRLNILIQLRPGQYAFLTEEQLSSVEDITLGFRYKEPQPRTFSNFLFFA